MSKGGRPYKVSDEVKMLFTSIRQGDLNTVKKVLMKHGIDAYDPDKRTALINASFYGQIEILIWLIENGADVNYQDKKGYTALHFAAQEKRIEVLKILLPNNANPNLKDKHGNSPLWTAVFNAKGDFEFVKELIKANADLDSINNYDKSPRDLGVSIYGEKFEQQIY